MARTARTFSTEEKRNLLNLWKESGLSLPAWRKKYAEELGLPHLSTLYDWCKSLGFTTEPGKPEDPEESLETPDEAEDSTDFGEADETTEEGNSGGEEEPIREGGEEVIAKDRIINLEPSTVPEPPKGETPKETPKGEGISKTVFIVIGGALVFGIGGYLMFKKLRRKPKAHEPATKQSKGGIPFDGGYTTIDDF